MYFFIKAKLTGYNGTLVTVQFVHNSFKTIIICMFKCILLLYFFLFTCKVTLLLLQHNILLYTCSHVI